MLLDMVQAMSTVKSRFTDTRLLRTPHYCGQFALSPGKESSIHCLYWGNPPLVPAISVHPSLAVLTDV